MKKKYIYMLVPLCGLIVFCLFYIPFANHYDALQAQQHKEEIAKRNQELEKEAEDRAEASRKANEAAAVRKAEREAKAAREKAEKDALDAADAARQKAFNDRQKYEQEITGLKKEIKIEQDAIAELQTTKDDTIKEQEFLKSYVQQAEINRQSIQSLLDKLAAAEKARADEDAARKAAANNS
jgi:colicin import membrane protein